VGERVSTLVRDDLLLVDSARRHKEGTPTRKADAPYLSHIFSV